MVRLRVLRRLDDLVIGEHIFGFFRPMGMDLARHLGPRTIGANDGAGDTLTGLACSSAACSLDVTGV